MSGRGIQSLALGGDEFVALLENLSENQEQAAAMVELIGERILEIINQPIKVEGMEHFNSSSIGICLFRGHDVSSDDLMKRADMAMYQAKNAGRHTMRFFDPAMQSALEARIALENELRHAIEQGQFKLFYQIQVDCEQHIIGAEALLRWQHPVRGLVTPDVFIATAEETGLVIPIGLWVLQSAALQLRLWENDPGTARLHLAVNISPKQFHQPDFTEQVRRIVNEFQIKPGRLKLELTESMVLMNVDSTVQKMTELRKSGISFSMDDFGTGHTTLAYLKHLPLDQIKIDESFIQDSIKDERDAMIVRAIIGMAENMGFEVIAEGVETEQQKEFLKLNGCPRFQGFLLGRPMPIEELEIQIKQ